MYALMVWFYGFQIKFCQHYFHFSFSGESERSNLAHIFPQPTNTPVNIQTSDHTGLNLELRHCKPHWVSWSSLSPCVCHSQFHTLWFSDSSPLSLFPSLSLSRSFCLSLRLTAGLGLHFHTCLIGCSPWAAVESPPAASDRQRQSCLGKTCLLLFPPPPPSNVSVWTAASRRMGLVHERVFKCVCMCAWIRPLQENYHFRFHSITASKHIQAFITHFIRLMFTDPDNVKPKGPSLERNSEKFSLSFWCKDNINSVSFLCSERPQLFEWTYNNLYSCIILIHVGCHSWT